MEVILITLGERIKEQRKAHGLSQEKMAELVGVSRQAVTKWESGQSAPSTENLFKLAEIFGTTVDMLLKSAEGESKALAEQIYELDKAEEAKKRAALRAARKRNLGWALAILAGYLAIYLAGRILGTQEGSYSATGWLFGISPQQLSYLYGWLLQRKLFWIALAISVAAALMGKRFFAVVNLLGFGLGLLLGELLGPNPPGAPYGQGHFGWAIWGGIYLLSFPFGIVLNRMMQRASKPEPRRIRLWCVAFILCILLTVLLVRCGIPETYGG